MNKPFGSFTLHMYRKALKRQIPSHLYRHCLSLSPISTSHRAPVPLHIQSEFHPPSYKPPGDLSYPWKLFTNQLSCDHQIASWYSNLILVHEQKAPGTSVPRSDLKGGFMSTSAWPVTQQSTLVQLKNRWSGDRCWGRDYWLASHSQSAARMPQSQVLSLEVGRVLGGGRGLRGGLSLKPESGPDRKTPVKSWAP